MTEHNHAYGRMLEDGGSSEPGNYAAAERALDDFEEPLAPDHDGPCIALCEYKCDKWVEAQTHYSYDAATNYIHKFIGGIHSCNDERCDW